MGKIGATSWLTAVRRAFRSPTKENDQKSTRRREDHEQEDEEKKRGKRRWMFRKSSVQETVIQHCEAKTITTMPTITSSCEAADAKQRHALAVAMATTAAAQAAVATAQAAVEVVRLSRPSLFVKQHFAAIAIQTAFRGYLARRALRALKGLVKLQALVRGHNVRKRAKMTLKCMQALMRVQERMCDQRKRLSYDGSKNSVSSTTDHNILDTGREESNTVDQDLPQTLEEEIQAMLKETKEAALESENALASAFSYQIWVPGRDTYASEGEVEDRWATRKHYWDSREGDLCGDHRESIKTVEMDTSRPYSYSTTNITHKSYYQQQQQRPRPSSYSVSSPLRRTHNNNFSYQPPVLVTPIQSTSRKRTLPQANSASPRCLREYKNRGILGRAPNTTANLILPNYMAATASAKARFRSQSAPKQRPSTPEKERMGGARKRLYFPVPDAVASNSNDGDNINIDYGLMRSPIYKGHSSYGVHIGMEQRFNMSSCCTDSIGDEVSPPLTNDLSRWLR